MSVLPGWLLHSWVELSKFCSLKLFLVDISELRTNANRKRTRSHQTVRPGCPKSVAKKWPNAIFSTLKLDAAYPHSRLNGAKTSGLVDGRSVDAVGAVGAVGAIGVVGGSVGVGSVVGGSVMVTVTIVVSSLGPRLFLSIYISCRAF